MKKKVAFIFSCLLLPLILFGQTPPRWINETWRTSSYPQNVYYSGFVSADTGNETVITMENAAKRKVMESIRVHLKSELTTKNEDYGTRETYREYTKDEMQSLAEAEIVGIKVESYKEKNVIYAFAYVNKYELIDYYKNNLLVNIRQVESFIKTAQDLKANNEKSKARQQLETAKPIFSKIRYAQDILTVLDNNVSAEDLQQEKSETLYNTFAQMQAGLAQSIYVYAESNEDLLGQKVNIVANKIKAELSVNGCSFVEDATQADFLLNIDVSTRITGDFNGLVFCNADTQIKLYDTQKQKTVYSDDISVKGGSNTEEKAGRKAMENVVLPVVEKLKNQINN